MISIKDKKACCGCGACSQACPKHCIAMQTDEEGFLYPVVDESACVSCGLCEKVCTLINKKEEKIDTKTYVAYAKDDSKRLVSSSGGIFTLLAEKVLQEGGTVFGAAFDEKFGVHHVKAETANELENLKGSKYLQSRTEETFRMAKQLLEDGKQVLFTGTGCQIAGLKSYLGKDYVNLITADVLCHGVPSPKLWKKYLEHQEKLHSAAVQRTFFRLKKTGWKTYALSLEFTNDNAYVRIFKEDPYMQMFLKNICLRPSCYDCKYKAMKSQADITLGDCWGIEKYMPEMDDDKGTSVLLVHTEKGQEYIDSIRKELIIKEAEVDKVSQQMMFQSVSEHPRRARFFKELNEGKSIDDLLKLVSPTFSERIVRKVKRILK